ncbi:MAG TPA: sugar nucleotide-binding protein [Candidatus Kapabacteria bacterium]|nr:sugar nucleotide-binding protein [Candidatus Kapabacteria bacterium]
MKKILLIGRGQIGQALSKDLADFSIHSWPHDLDDLSIDEIRSIAPDAIVNAAGKTNLAWCETNAREAIRSNLEAPIRLYKRILTHNREHSEKIRFVHFSSGCIWDGPYDENGNPFTPDSPPSPVCLYSWTKAAADSMLLQENSSSVAILRPRQIYSGSLSARNTLVKLMKYPRLVDTPNSMSSIEVIEKTLRYVLTSKDNWSGVWNVYDQGIATPFEIGQMLASEGLRGMPEKITKEELDRFHFPKRVDTVLHDARFEAAIRPNTIHSELQKAIAELKGNDEIRIRNDEIQVMTSS